MSVLFEQGTSPTRAHCKFLLDSGKFARRTNPLYLPTYVWN